MAGVRDPAFWKRFSVAVHMDEEQAEKQGPQHKDECVYPTFSMLQHLGIETLHVLTRHLTETHG
jgi:hypothetical protein